MTLCFFAVHSLSMGEKKTSEVGLVFFHLYKGIGFPELDMQIRVTFPFTSGFPVIEHFGTEGGTEGRGLCNVLLQDFLFYCFTVNLRSTAVQRVNFPYLSHPG